MTVLHSYHTTEKAPKVFEFARPFYLVSSHVILFLFLRYDRVYLGGF